MLGESAPASQVHARPRIVPAKPAFLADALVLARSLGTELLSPERWCDAGADEVVLWLDAAGIGLRGPPRGARPRWPRPPTRPRAGRELLVRALGARPTTVHVVDATAGLAGDAAVLAGAGARVTLVERSPSVAAMLADAVARWRDAAVPGADRLALVPGAAEDVLERLEAVDVVLLDPFFPGRDERETTAVEMRWLRALIAAESMVPEEEVSAATDPAAQRAAEARLLAAARRAAGLRVVVKRPRAAPPLAGVQPSGSLRGRVVRLDLYPPSPRQHP